MVAFDDHAPGQPNIVTTALSNLGSRSQPRLPPTPIRLISALGRAKPFTNPPERMHQRGAEDANNQGNQRFRGTLDTAAAGDDAAAIA